MTTITLTDARSRERGHRAIINAPDGYEVEIREPEPTPEMRRKFYAMMGDFAKQVEHAGQRWDKDTWAAIFIAATHKDRMVPNLRRDGFVVLRRSWKQLRIKEAADCITNAYAEGNERGVKWSEPVFDQHGQLQDAAA